MSMTRLTLDCYRPMRENLIYYNENGFHMNLSFEEKDIDHIDMGETYNASRQLKQPPLYQGNNHTQKVQTQITTK